MTVELNPEHPLSLRATVDFVAGGSSEPSIGVGMNGIVLAGGAGTRLDPLTRVTSKQLLPVFDKPMIHYPIATLMLAGVDNILVICSPRDLDGFTRLLGDGTRWGLHITFRVQDYPNGIAESVLIGADMFRSAPTLLILGDNLFYGKDFSGDLLLNHRPDNALIFGYQVADPQHYAVLEVAQTGRILSLEEKPLNPRSNTAVPGLYVLPRDAPLKVAEQAPSSRGELEITDLNKTYLAEERLQFRMLSRGTAWLDTGTFEGLHDAASFVRVIQERKGLRIACLEEIAYRMGLIDQVALDGIAEKSPPALANYLRGVLRSAVRLDKRSTSQVALEG